MPLPEESHTVTLLQRLIAENPNASAAEIAALVKAEERPKFDPAQYKHLKPEALAEMAELHEIWFDTERPAAEREQASERATYLERMARPVRGTVHWDPLEIEKLIAAVRRTASSNWKFPLIDALKKVEYLGERAVIELRRGKEPPAALKPREDQP